MAKTIVLVGRLDSKGQEYSYVKDILVRSGFNVIVVDSGTRGSPQFAAEISRAEVARAAGAAPDAVVDRSDENIEIQVMMKGAAIVARRLYDSGRLDGIMALGGSRGTAIGTAAMRAVPFGVPKVMVSTIASSDMRPYVGTRDITVIHSVTDILGLNPMTRRLLACAAGAVMGAVNADPGRAMSGKPLIALSSMGGVNRAVFAARRLMEERGLEVVAFHAVGTGGRAMEETIGLGLIDGVLDLVTHELTDSLFGGYYDPGPDRLETAGIKGIPQVIAPGCIDFIAFSPPESIPERFKDRRALKHTPEVAILRANKDEMRQIGEAMAARLNKASGPTVVAIPAGGFSPADRPGRPLYDPEADQTFVDALKQHLKPSVRVVEVDSHINDESFAARAVDLLGQLMSR